MEMFINMFTNMFNHVEITVMLACSLIWFTYRVWEFSERYVMGYFPQWSNLTLGHILLFPLLFNIIIGEIAFALFLGIVFLVVVVFYGVKCAFSYRIL
jgi:hypothetical protein